MHGKSRNFTSGRGSFSPGGPGDKGAPVDKNPWGHFHSHGHANYGTQPWNKGKVISYSCHSHRHPRFSSGTGHGHGAKKHDIDHCGTSPWGWRPGVPQGSFNRGK